MAKHNWQTTERMCIYCGAVVRRDMQPCGRCGGSLEWNAFDLLGTVVAYALRLAVLAIVLPVVFYLIGTMSPVQIVVERDLPQMRANGACFVPMPAAKTLISIRAQCPTSHIVMRYPAQTRSFVIAFDSLRHEPWALGVSGVYDELFIRIDALIEWVAAGMIVRTQSPNLHAHWRA